MRLPWLVQQRATFDQLVAATLAKISTDFYSKDKLTARRSLSVSIFAPVIELINETCAMMN